MYIFDEGFHTQADVKSLYKKKDPRFQMLQVTKVILVILVSKFNMHNKIFST